MQSPQGNGSIKGYFARPASAGTNKLPAILVIHENRGLNPYIEDVARRLALANFMAFAPDGLTSVGGYPKGTDAAKNEEEAAAEFGKVDRPKMTEDFVASAHVAEESSRFDRQARSGRLLLRRRHRQHAGRAAGRGSGGGSSVLRRRTA